MKDIAIYIIVVFAMLGAGWATWYITIKTIPPLRVEIIGMEELTNSIKDYTIHEEILYHKIQELDYEISIVTQKGLK